MQYNFNKADFKELLDLKDSDDQALEANCLRDFATLGMAGIDPKKDNYSVSSIDKKMSGYQALAFYYVSWALAVPEHLEELNMPFEREYEVVKKMNK
ncbi:MAG: hypothetical protein LAT51_08150 [Flavobacteriaceae bacterium]|nr:hypothetical protein [Flavobacteriaceae bacterium]